MMVLMWPREKSNVFTFVNHLNDGLTNIPVCVYARRNNRRTRVPIDNNLLRLIGRVLITKTHTIAVVCNYYVLISNARSPAGRFISFVFVSTYVYGVCIVVHRLLNCSHENRLLQVYK